MKTFKQYALLAIRKRIFLLSLILLPALPISGFAAEIQVPSQFPTIQAAIDGSQNGDVIIVQLGTYAENINFNGKAITLTSTNPLDSTIVASTIIDGSMNGSVITFDSSETPNSVLTGFTIRNGNGTLIDGKRYGGGIFCGLHAAPTIRHNKIINNTADVGGAVYIHGDSPPVITSGPNGDYPYVNKSQMVGLSVTATDPDGDALVYTWTPREGGTITGTGGSVSFSAATAGVYHIDLSIDDQHGGKATGVVTVTVIGIAIQAMPQLKVGQSASISATLIPPVANSPEYPVSITWSVTEGPAAGTFDAAVNGTPQATSINFTPSASGPGRIQAAYQVGMVSTNHSAAIVLNPIVLTIDPVSGKQGETIQATISGNNFGRVSSLSLGGSGVTASIREGRTEDSLPVQFVISKEAAAGNRAVSLITPEGTFSTSLTFQIIALPPITASPTSLNIVVGNTGPIVFSIPGPAPAGGVTLSLSSSATSVATVPASATIPQGQTSVQVSITSVGVGTATITADATAYSKVQVPVTVANSPLTGYFYRKTLTIDHTKVPSTLTNFPVVVSISNDSDLKNHVTSVNGYDLIFIDAGGNKLNHELERWDGSTGTVVAWVKVPALSSTTDTVVYMWYGNSWVTTSQENRTGVWDSNYKGVWHLKEATGASIADSTSNGNTGTPQNSPAQTTGNIDGGLSLNGTSQYVTTPITTVYQQFTLSAWIKPSSAGSGAPTIISKNSYYATSWTDWPVAFFVSADGTRVWITVTPGIDYSTVLTAVSPAFAPDQWHHVVATYDGTTLRAYADGAYNQVTGSYTLPSNSRYWTIGRAAMEAGGGIGTSSYKGSIDDVRISNVARSADWILTKYRNQSSPSSFFTAGSEGVNHAPVAQNQSVTTNRDTPKAITLVATDSDGDPLTYQIVGQPGHGTLTGTAPNMTYTPATGFYGVDSFTFKTNDANLDSNVATISISVALDCGYRKTITIDHTKVPSTLSDFPVLVSISNDNDLKNHIMSANGYDLIFMDASGNQLTHELERWDGSTGTLVAWVKVPVLSSTTDTVISLQYGKDGVTTSLENKTGVWNSFKGVWHLPNGNTLTTNDSTGNGNNGTNYGVTATAGKIDGAGNFNGTGHYVDVGVMPAIQGSSNLTISMWVYQSSYQATAYIDKNANNGILFQPWNDQRVYFAINGIGNRAVTNAGDAPLNSWFNLVGVYDGSNIIIYINGQQKATSPKTTTIPTDGAHILIGNNPGMGTSFIGLLDEVRISNVARSADWILTEYRNQGSPSTFYVVGSEEQIGPRVNHAPIAQNQSVTLSPDETKAITLVATDADGDPLTYQIVVQPTHGTLSGTPPNVTYTPAAGYTGPDSFTFKANDGMADSNVPTVSITVTPVSGVGFLYRKTITIDHTKVSATLSNFPFMVSIANDNDLKNHVSSPSGYDIVFIDSSGTLLDHEMEKWDGATGTLVAWVRIPSLSSTSDTVISMLYGNTGVTTSQENRTSVWDSNFVGVWHLPNGSTLTANDSTGNGNNGTNYGATGAAGKIDGAGSFDGTNDYISFNQSALENVFASGSPWTISLWVMPGRNPASWAWIWCKAYTSHSDPYYQIDLKQYPSNIIGAYIWSTSYGTGAYLSQAATLTSGVWNKVDIVGQGGGTSPFLSLYVNGNLIGTDTTPNGSYAHYSTPITLGMDANIIGSYYAFAGSMDESRISNVARSADWILTEYRNQSSPSTFYGIGSEGPGGPVNHAPVAQNQSVTTNQDTAKAITLVATDADGDALTYQIVAEPAHGALSGTPPNVTYTPAAGYSGSDSFTFKANDGMADSNVATISILVASTAGGNDSYAKSLLHMNGTDGSTTFADNAAGGTHTWTAFGNAQIDITQSKFGGVSGLFDGSGDYIQTPYSEDFDFGTGDFTWDLWARWNSLPAAESSHVFITVGRMTDNNNVNVFYLNNNNGTYRLYFVAIAGGVTKANYYQTSGWSVSPGIWYHLALVRSGGNVYIFVNGISQTLTASTPTGSNSITPALNEATTIARYGNYTGYDYNGWLDEVRISKGIARWTSNFTPPTQEYSD